MRLLAVLAVALAACAQSPVAVQFQCSEEDLQWIGQNCSNSEPCPLYLELSALDVVGARLFITGNLHTQTSTLASILLASFDGGKTWTEPYKRIPNSGLDQIQFLDFEVGWIGGQSLLGTPKDPFLLITRDGGKSWRLYPIVEETHPGMIEQFSFESRTRGTLVIDRVQSGENGVRYELYESMTGGESWQLQQAGASPIRLKRYQSTGNPDWRLRPDAASKTYRVEHQEAGKWSAAAVFPVRVGECKEIERTLSDAPAPEPDKAEPEPAKKDDTPPAPKKVPTLKKKRP